jgi:hypothetical protein
MDFIDTRCFDCDSMNLNYIAMTKLQIKKKAKHEEKT